MPADPVPSQSERESERFHLLATVVTYPSMSTADVCDRANSECQHDLFDPLPMVAPQATAPKLKALERDGLISGWVDFDGVRWDPTDEGKEAWATYEAGLNAPPQNVADPSITPERRSALFVLNDLKDKLAEMELHDDLPNSHDIGYMAAWREIKEWADAR